MNEIILSDGRNLIKSIKYPEKVRVFSYGCYGMDYCLNVLIDLDSKKTDINGNTTYLTHDKKGKPFRRIEMNKRTYDILMKLKENKYLEIRHYNLKTKETKVKRKLKRKLLPTEDEYYHVYKYTKKIDKTNKSKMIMFVTTQEIIPTSSFIKNGNKLINSKSKIYTKDEEQTQSILDSYNFCILIRLDKRFEKFIKIIYCNGMDIFEIRERIISFYNSIKDDLNYDYLSDVSEIELKKSIEMIMNELIELYSMETVDEDNYEEAFDKYVQNLLNTPQETLLKQLKGVRTMLEIKTTKEIYKNYVVNIVPREDTNNKEGISKESLIKTLNSWKPVDEIEYLSNEDKMYIEIVDEITNYGEKTNGKSIYSRRLY